MAVFCLVFGLAASIAAAVVSSPRSSWSGRAVRAATLFAVLLLLPVHVVAALQIRGWTDRVRFGSIAAVQALLAVVVLLVAYRLRSTQGELEATSPPRSRPAFLRVSWVVAAIAYLVFLGRVAVGWPQDWDGVAYHLPLALRWLQEGSLALPADGNWRFSLPGNGEIPFFYMLGAHLERWSGLVSLASAALLGVAVYRLARLASRSREAAEAAAIIALTIPMVTAQAFAHYVDLFGTAFTLAGGVLLLEAGPLPRGRELLLAGLALGAALGTKPVFVVYAAPTLLLALAWAASRRRGRAALLLVAGTACLSCFWYGRALASSGNPLFPLQVRVGTTVLLPGVPSETITPPDFDREFVESPAGWLAYPWREWKRNVGGSGIPYGVDSGLGALFATFAVVGVAFSVRRLRWREPTAEAWIAAFVVLGLVAWAVALRRMPRFGLPVWCAACASASLLLNRLMSARSKGFVALWMAALVSTVGLAASKPLYEAASVLRHRRFDRAAFYAYPPWLDRVPAGARVANCAGFNNMIPAGKALAVRVLPGFAVPARPSEEWLRDEGVDFVLERRPSGSASPGCDALPPLPVSQESTVQSGAERIEWRLSQVTASD